jgi:hypothetical protein
MNAPSPAVQNRATAAADASVSQQIAEFAAGVTYESLPVRVRERAKLLHNARDLAALIAG